MHKTTLASAAWPADLIRALVVPQVAPPYDDELDGGNDGLPPVRGTAMPGRLPAGPDPAGAPSARPGPALGGDDSTPADHGPGGEHDPGDRGGGWPAQFAQLLAETLAGSRPAHQLTPWTTEQARRRIRQLGPALATGQRPRVRRVLTSSPASGVLELTAVVGFGPRVRALALRLERHRSGRGPWCCTAIESA